MGYPKLIINSERDYPLDADLITVGRISENDISFPDDTNVSRFHAEIENRGGEYWLIDLGSFNGTTLNGSKLDGEKPLNDGDQIVLAGTSEIEVLFNPKEDDDDEEKEEVEEIPDVETDKSEPEEAPPHAPRSKMPFMLIVTAITVGLAVVFVAAAGIYYVTREEPKCIASAKITSPENGDTIREATEIEIEIENENCVKSVSYVVEDEEIARSGDPPFSASIDPDDFPVSDGLFRNLKVVLYDEKGRKINQSENVAFNVETMAIEAPEKPEQLDTPIDDAPKPNKPKPGNGIAFRESKKMAANVVKQFSGSFNYNVSNPRFLNEVGKKTKEYVSEGYFQRADKYRDVINLAYIRGQNLDPPLGYILAMSRSKFSPKNTTDGTGLWRMSDEFVKANAYDGLCGTETIASPSQNCAAKASALYLKNLIINVFEGDVIYGVAAFGMSVQEAANWKATLPENRADFWNVIKSPKQRQEVVNFFAAAVVAENPQRFGLKKDKPLSEHYSIFVQ